MNFYETYCKVNGKEYRPYKQSDTTKSISNYRIHKSSIEPYRKCGQKVISYVIKCLDKVFIIGARFVFKDKFDKQFVIVGLTPQHLHWTRTNRLEFLAKRNIAIKAYNLYSDMIELEKHDYYKWSAYENKLTLLFRKAKEERQKKVDYMKKIKAEIIDDSIAERESLFSQTDELAEREVKPPDIDFDIPDFDLI